MDGMNIQELMSEAKKQYEVLQKKLQETVVEGTSGGGSVTVKMDGRKQVLGIKIDPEVVKDGDLEMDDAMQSTMGGMFSGMGL
jgi:DNA-binding YbaB/EbfC family protein